MIHQSDRKIEGTPFERSFALGELLKDRDGCHPVTEERLRPCRPKPATIVLGDQRPTKLIPEIDPSKFAHEPQGAPTDQWFIIQERSESRPWVGAVKRASHDAC